MSAITLQAPAKTNLWLRVTRKRDDGFHEIDTRMVPLSLSDSLKIKPTTGNTVSLTCNEPDVPIDEGNLVMKAVRALEERTGHRFGAEIHLEKQIPHGAGLGGGSSDAATALRGFNELFDLGLERSVLAEIAGSIGSDIPFFVWETVCDCTGRGEIVTPVEFDWELPVFLMKPGFAVPTGPAYGLWTESREIPGIPYAPQLCPWGTMVNDLERPVFQKYLMLARMKEWLLDQREVHAAMLSGSGSSLLAVLTRNDRGRILEERALQTFGPNTWTWVGHTLRA
ncbi:MAG: 4-(cytidine 5'-diphospho)-2-C-methyl-D-erythritol kinase [Verrucomicrobiae bacterium]|nr:4-(cytidine 5'-diphospho)-2-C-methyl-D-erythritol kinase [Verrucomicrobiae bacterium]